MGRPFARLLSETEFVSRGTSSQLSDGFSEPGRNWSLSSYTGKTLASGSVPSFRIAR